MHQTATWVFTLAAVLLPSLVFAQGALERPP